MLAKAETFTIHTEISGFESGCLSKESVLASMHKSLEKLRLEHVETYFLHSPDPDTPLEETLGAVKELYTAGKFKKFGLSNFRATADLLYMFIDRLRTSQCLRGKLQPHRQTRRGRAAPPDTEAEDGILRLLSNGRRFPSQDCRAIRARH